MNFVLSLIYIVTVIAEVISIFILIGRGKKCMETYMFLGCQISGMLWCISQICIFLAESQIQMEFSYLIGNIGICFIGTFWLNFSLCFQGRENRTVMMGSFLISFFEFIVIMTNSFHSLYYEKISLYEKSYGIFFYINKVYVYLCVIGGSFVILKYREKIKEQTRQKLLLLVGALLPLGLNLFQQLGVIRVETELTPLGFSIACLAVFVAMFRYNFLNINQLALQELAEDIQEGIVVFSAGGAFSYMNRAAAIYTDGSKVENLQSFYQIFQEEQISKLEDKEEITFLRNGKYLQIQKVLSKNKNSDMIAISFLIKDVDKYYQIMEQSARMAVLEQKLAVESERNDIIQKVHDTVGHTLTMIQSLIKMGIYSLKEEETAKEHLKEAKKLAGNCIKELREYINENRNSKKSELITRCITKLAETVKEIEVEVSISGEDGERYSCYTEIVYLCIKELITNCLKYAGASKMQIIIKFCRDSMEIFVFDNGNGCDNIVYGNGFRGIKERITGAGGDFRTYSSLGEGFQVFMSLKL